MNGGGGMNGGGIPPGMGGICPVPPGIELPGGGNTGGAGVDDEEDGVVVVVVVVPLDWLDAANKQWCNVLVSVLSHKIPFLE